MGAVVAGLVAYDIWAYTGNAKTISRVIWETSETSDLVPFLFGLLMGHWFWPRGEE